MNLRGWRRTRGGAGEGLEKQELIGSKRTCTFAGAACEFFCLTNNSFEYCLLKKKENFSCHVLTKNMFFYLVFSLLPKAQLWFIFSLNKIQINKFTLCQIEKKM